MTAKQNKQGAKKILESRKPKKQTDSKRTIKHFNGISKNEEEAVVKFYEMLVPKNKSLPIDVELIVTKGFGVFEIVLGTAKWNKIKKYFGIGCKANYQNIKESEIMLYISELRTIENAQYYLHGFSKLLEKYAAKLTNAPEGMTTIEKAKVIRMFLLFFSSCYFFAEDFTKDDNGEIAINGLAIPVVNKMGVNPENMFFLYDAYGQLYAEKNLMYDAFIDEIKSYNKRIRKEIFEISELRFDVDGKVISVNKSIPNLTYSYIRKIKNQMFDYPRFLPNEFYISKNYLEELDFGFVYDIYDRITKKSLDQYPEHEKNVNFVEGDRVITKPISYRVVARDVEFSGQQEADRFKRFVNYLVKNNYTMIIALIDENDEKSTSPIEVGKFFSFLEFARNEKYINEQSGINEEYTLFRAYMNYDEGGENLGAYMRKEISAEELKVRVGIDRKFEEEVFEIEHEETPIETVKRFAIEKGIVDSESEISEELAENVLISGFEPNWQSYSKGEIDANKLMKKIGFEQDILQMYFNLAKIDIPKIEQKLLELKSKRTKDLKKYSLTILLYCYIVEGQICCGPKNKPPARNKRLKPDILRNLIAA